MVFTTGSIGSPIFYPAGSGCAQIVGHESIPTTGREVLTVSPEQMKREILKVYSGPNWAFKVEKMSDKQIAAVYLRFLNQGKLK